MNDQQEGSCPLVTGGQIMSQPMYNTDDEIDLFQLVEDVWEGRWLILGVTSIVAVLTAIILNFVPATYKVTAKIERPKNTNIAFVDERLASSLTTTHRFERSFQLLQSVDVWEAFQKQQLSSVSLSESPERAIRQQARESFGGLAFKVLSTIGEEVTEEIKVDHPAIVEVMYEGSSQEGIGPELNDYLLYVSDKVVMESLAEMKEVLRNRKQINENKVSWLREKALKSRLATIKRLESEQKEQLEKVDQEISVRIKSVLRGRDIQLSSLQEALAIANALGIKRPTSMDMLNDRQTENLKVLISDKTAMPTYLRGTQLLTKQIDILENRTDEELVAEQLEVLRTKRQMLEKNTVLEDLKSRASDDAYIEELPTLGATLSALNQFAVEDKNIHGFRVLAHPSDEGKKIKLRSVLILLASIMLVGMVCVVVVLIRASVIRRKETQK